MKLGALSTLILGKLLPKRREAVFLFFCLFLHPLLDIPLSLARPHLDRVVCDQSSIRLCSMRFDSHSPFGEADRPIRWPGTIDGCFEQPAYALAGQIVLRLHAE